MTINNVRNARARRPMPIWTEAFQRDIQYLNAEEVGAYFLLLMAMWRREACNFPNEDEKLARVTRLSGWRWRSKVGPVLRDFLNVEDGLLVSKSLKHEARKTEDFLKKQRRRKVRKTKKKDCAGVVASLYNTRISRKERHFLYTGKIY